MKRYDPNLYEYSDLGNQIPVELNISDGYLYVTTPLESYELNDTQLRYDGAPRIIIEYLINKGSGKLIEKDELRKLANISTSRDLRDIFSKAGFKGMVREIFLEVCEKDRIKLNTGAMLSLEEIERLEDELI